MGDFFFSFNYDFNSRTKRLGGAVGKPFSSSFYDMAHGQIFPIGRLFPDLNTAEKDLPCSTLPTPQACAVFQAIYLLGGTVGIPSAPKS